MNPANSIQSNDQILQDYIEAGFWSTFNEDYYANVGPDEHIEPHEHLTVDDIDFQSMQTLRCEIKQFVDNCGDLLNNLPVDLNVGHDLYFTRNGHGVGFWDRGLGAKGDQLSSIAHDLGDVNIVVVSGKIYLS